MGITMGEIAALAQVSQGAVSLVLNGKANGIISKAKQERILLIAKQHRYRVNIAAKSLRKKRQYAIGVIMPTPRDSFYATVVSLLQLKLAMRGYMTLFSFWQDVDGIDQAFDAVYDRRVDGIIAWDSTEQMGNSEIPIVFFDKVKKNQSSVRYDFTDSYRKLCDHLWQLGHRCFVFVGTEDDIRGEILRDFLLENAMAPGNSYLFHIDTASVERNNILAELLRLPVRPTALIASSDNTAKVIVFDALRHGLKVPEDLSIAGFMNQPDTDLMIPSLTTFDGKSEELTDLLVEQVLQPITHPERPPQQISIQPELILRDSCGPAKK